MSEMREAPSREIWESEVNKDRTSHEDNPVQNKGEIIVDTSKMIFVFGS